MSILLFILMYPYFGQACITIYRRCLIDIEADELDVSCSCTCLLSMHSKDPVLLLPLLLFCSVVIGLFSVYSMQLLRLDSLIPVLLFSCTSILCTVRHVESGFLLAWYACYVQHDNHEGVHSCEKGLVVMHCM